MIPPSKSMVLRLADLVQFEGEGNYPAAALSVEPHERHIHVATVQVNRLDGATDTVV